MVPMVDPMKAVGVVETPQRSKPCQNQPRNLSQFLDYESYGYGNLTDSIAFASVSTSVRHVSSCGDRWEYIDIRTVLFPHSNWYLATSSRYPNAVTRPLQVRSPSTPE